MTATTYRLISNAEDTSQDGDAYCSTGWIVPPCGMDPEIRGDDADGKAMDSVAWPVTEDPEEAVRLMDRALAEAGWRRVSDWRVDGAEWATDIEPRRTEPMTINETLAREIAAGWISSARRDQAITAFATGASYDKRELIVNIRRNRSDVVANPDSYEDPAEALSELDELLRWAQAIDIEKEGR